MLLLTFFWFRAGNFLFLEKVNSLPFISGKVNNLSLVKSTNFYKVLIIRSIHKERMSLAHPVQWKVLNSKYIADECRELDTSPPNSPSGSELDEPGPSFSPLHVSRSRPALPGSNFNNPASSYPASSHPASSFSNPASRYHNPGPSYYSRQ